MIEASTSSGPPVVQPKSSGNTILVRKNQTGNPVLKLLQIVRYEIADIVCDFEVGKTTGVLFLSLKYHRLYPEYIHGRIALLGKKYTLRILLILCDVGDQHENPIRELTKVCLINGLTVVVAWSYEEVAIYLQTYKAFENKPADSIKERVDQDYSSILRAALTGIKGVNKTDVVSLRTHFGSFSNIAHASPEDLANCPGIGSVKVRRLNEALVQPFRRTAGPMTTKDSRQVGALDTSARSTQNAGPVLDTVVSNNGLQLNKLHEQDPRFGRQPSLSPPWDIDLDLNPSEDEDIRSPSTRLAMPEDITQSTLPSRQRVASPDWNIDWTKETENDSSELVVEQAEVVVTPARKKQRTNPFSPTPL